MGGWWRHAGEMEKKIGCFAIRRRDVGISTFMVFYKELVKSIVDT